MSESFVDRIISAATAIGGDWTLQRHVIKSYFDKTDLFKTMVVNHQGKQVHLSIYRIYESIYCWYDVANRYGEVSSCGLEEVISQAPHLRTKILWSSNNRTYPLVPELG